MQVLRVFNNNVILARRGGEEVVVTGRGVGFGAKQGDTVDPAGVQRVFVPVDGRDPDHSGEMIAGLPAATVHAVADALDSVGVPAKLTLTTAIADHVSLAVTREKPIAYPLRDEVAALYPEEYRTARDLLEQLNDVLDVSLPDTEATALAMHLVNAGFNTGDLSRTYQMTGVIQQILEIVGEDLGLELEQSEISNARFITHLRYLFTRLEQHKQLVGGPSELARQLAAQHPRAMDTARKVGTVIELRFDKPLTEDEIAYLGLHIARLQATASDTAHNQKEPHND